MEVKTSASWVHVGTMLPYFWMLKNDTFLTSILEGFGPRFGRVVGRFFEPKMHAKSETLNYVKNEQNTAWAHVFLMLALATTIKIRAKNR